MEGVVINTLATAALIGKQINKNVKDDESGVGDDDDCDANSLCRWLSRCTKERREQALLVSPRV